MTQTRTMSAIETAVNIGIGLIVSLTSQLVIFKLYAIHIAFHQNVEITLYFTIISILRSYGIRRAFNWWGHRA